LPICIYDTKQEEGCQAKCVIFRALLDFPPVIPYNTPIGNDGTKYPLHVRLKRAFGWWKKAAAALANTSLSTGMKLCSSVPTVRRLQRVHEGMSFFHAEWKWYRVCTPSSPISGARRFFI